MTNVSVTGNEVTGTAAINSAGGVGIFGTTVATITGGAISDNTTTGGNGGGCISARTPTSRCPVPRSAATRVRWAAASCVRPTPP